MDAYIPRLATTYWGNTLLIFTQCTSVVTMFNWNWILSINWGGDGLNWATLAPIAFIAEANLNGAFPASLTKTKIAYTSVTASFRLQKQKSRHSAYSKMQKKWMLLLLGGAPQWPQLYSSYRTNSMNSWRKKERNVIFKNFPKPLWEFLAAPSVKAWVCLGGSVVRGLNFGTPIWEVEWYTYFEYLLYTSHIGKVPIKNKDYQEVPLRFWKIQKDPLVDVWPHVMEKGNFCAYMSLDYIH